MPILVLAYLVTMITHFWGDFYSIQWESLSRHLSKQSAQFYSSVHALLVISLNELHLHRFLRTENTEASKSLKTMQTELISKITNEKKD